MTKEYDLVIVGAGPGGTVASKTAGENGLKTAILERKINPAEITRGCAMMFAVESDYYFGERMYYNEKNKKILREWIQRRLAGKKNKHHKDYQDLCNYAGN